jgi:hypothetical protein
MRFKGIKRWCPFLVKHELITHLMWGEKQESLGSGRWAYGHIVKPYSYFLVKKAVPCKDMLHRICFHTPKSAFCSGRCAEHAITMCCHIYWSSWARMSALMAAFGTHSWRQTSLLGGCGQIQVVGFFLPVVGKDWCLHGFVPMFQWPDPQQEW